MDYVYSCFCEKIFLLTNVLGRRELGEGEGREIRRRESSAKQLIAVIEISPTPIHTIRLILVPIRTPCKISRGMDPHLLLHLPLWTGKGYGCLLSEGYRVERHSPAVEWEWSSGTCSSSAWVLRRTARSSFQPTSADLRPWSSSEPSAALSSSASGPSARIKVIRLTLNSKLELRILELS